MRAVSIVALLGALVLGLATISVVHTLSNLHETSGAIVAGLMEGDAHLLYMRAETWTDLLRALTSTSPWSFWHLESVLSIGGTTALVLWLCRRNGWRQHAVAGLACLASAAVPWLVGRAVILRLDDPMQIGNWLAWMVLSVFWGCVACGALAAWQLCSQRRAEPSPAAALADA